MSTTIRFAIAAVIALGLAACEEPASPEVAAEGTPAAPIDTTTLEYFQQAVGDRVFFQTDSASIAALGQQTLNRQAVWFNQNPNITISVHGHADERGTREYNLALGARRAEAARAFLVSQGVSPGRITTISYGKERPEALCSAETCWSQNRRAVSVIAGAPSS